MGWNVTVYNHCETEKEIEGVRWIPFYEWNRFDKQDVTVIWRRPQEAQQTINSEKIYIDLHDVGQPDQLNRIRCDKVFVKSKYHRSLYRVDDDSKFAIIPNGINYESLQLDVERDPYLIFNTSAPYRALGTLIELFLRVKEGIPEAKLAWAYGWSLYDDLYERDRRRMKWKANMIHAMKQNGIYNLNRITHQNIAELSCKAAVFAYPTCFPEVCCVSAIKAQAGGAMPVTTDVGALNEYIIGETIHANHVQCNGQMDYGIIDEEEKQQWVDLVIKRLTHPVEMDRHYFKKFDWSFIARQWNEVLNG